MENAESQLKPNGKACDATGLVLATVKNPKAAGRLTGDLVERGRERVANVVRHSRALDEVERRRAKQYIEPEHYVPIRTRYWDHAGVEVKQLHAKREAIQEIDGIWVPLEARMDHLVGETYTELRVVLLTPNPELPKSFFTQRQLETRKLRLPSRLVRDALRF